MNRRSDLFIRDLLGAIELIQEFVKDLSKESFMFDNKTKSAVVRQLEIIGEAARHIPAELKQSYRDIPWSDIVAMRNRISHDYFGVDFETVWEVVSNDLPALESQVKTMMDDLNIPPKTEKHA